MKFRNLIITALILLMLVISAFFVLFFTIAIPDKHGPQFIYISKGDNIDTVVKQAESKKIVTSAGILRSIMLWFGDEKKIRGGYYEFETEQNIFQVAWRLTHAGYGYTPVKVTIPEGSDYRKVTSIFSKKFAQIPADSLESIFKENEGYIYPETYFFPPKAWPEFMIDRTKQEFDTVYKGLIKTIDETRKSEEGIEIFGKYRSDKDVLIMASIIEGEANTEESRRIVSGILWKRIDLGMPLQVDATLRYVTQRGSSELTKTDLLSTDLFNTYTHLGLPPKPILNPGKDSLDAALNPATSTFLFFLTGDDGVMYYANTFKEHIKLKNSYIK